MIKITTERTVGTTIELQSAILVYGDKSKAAYASHHPVRQVGGRSLIGPGTSLSAAVLTKAVRDLSPVSTTDCFIDDNVIAFRDGLIGWWRAPKTTRLWFHSPSLHEARELPGNPRPFAVEVPVPGLIFFVMAGHFYVYAFKGDRRPDRKTEIFTAPLMNVWDSGQICTGNVKLPKSSKSSTTPAWEKAFFKSRFTHFNGKASVQYEGGRIALTRDLVEGKFTSFPDSVMSSIKLTLGDLVGKFSKRCAEGSEGGIDYV